MWVFFGSETCFHCLYFKSSICKHASFIVSPLVFFLSIFRKAFFLDERLQFSLFVVLLMHFETSVKLFYVSPSYLLTVGVTWPINQHMICVWWLLRWHGLPFFTIMQSWWDGFPPSLCVHQFRSEGLYNYYFFFCEVCLSKITNAIFQSHRLRFVQSLVVFDLLSHSWYTVLPLLGLCFLRQHTGVHYHLILICENF